MMESTLDGKPTIKLRFWLLSMEIQVTMIQRIELLLFNTLWLGYKRLNKKMCLCNLVVEKIPLRALECEHGGLHVHCPLNTITIFL